MHDDLELDTDEQRPIKQSFFGSLRRDAHWKCLILTLLIFGCLAAIAWCRLAVLKKPTPSPSLSYFTFAVSGRHDPDSVRESPCDDGYVYIPVAFVIMLYLVYLVECWHSHTRIELQYKVDINTVYDKVRDMREGVPIIWWKAICYHYVRRTRQVTRYRNGDAFTSTQVYYERVNTCTAGSAFNFTQCGVKDISRSLRGLEDYPATKIRFSKGFSFASVDSECEFEDQRAQFFQEYENRDDYMEGREGMDVLNVNFKEYMIAFADPDNLPWYVSHVIFWIASFLLLSWPLRVIIEFKTAHLHYHVHKLFGTHYVDMETLRGTMSRASTMNSTEMEMNIRNNNFMVPSYSDAMLMNAARRASLLSVMTTGGGPRYFFGSSAPRSVTNPALHNSRSGTFVPGSLPSFPMTTVRRFQSCTAINHGDKPPIIQSRSSILTNLLGLGSSNNNSAINVLSEENAANQRMDRRRWRRKRPTSSITFSGSFVGSMLPTTPETPEGCSMGVDSSISSTFVTAGGDAAGDEIRTEDCPPPALACANRSLRGGGDLSSSRSRLPYVDSSLSMSLSETFSGNFSSTGSEGEAPPAYTDALAMPRLDRSDSRGSGRTPRDDSLQSALNNSSGEINRSRVLQYSGHATRPRLQHSESLRLFSMNHGQNCRFYHSTSQELDQRAPLRSAGLVRNDSAPRLSCSESQGFDGQADNGRPFLRHDISRTSRHLRGADTARHLHSDDLDRCQGRSVRVRERGPDDSGTENLSYQATGNHSLTSCAIFSFQNRHQNLKTPDNPSRANLIRNDSYPASQRRHDIRADSPVVLPSLTSSPYARLEVEENETTGNGSRTSRARMELSLIPLRLPAVVTPCTTLSDDEDMTPLRDGGSLTSLIGSASNLAGHDPSELEPRGVGGNDNPVSSFALEGPSSVVEAAAARSESERSGPAASASTRLISPSTAQRCYRSIRCMETAL